jgi:hypothetical protein
MNNRHFIGNLSETNALYSLPDLLERERVDLHSRWGKPTSWMFMALHACYGFDNRS